MQIQVQASDQGNPEKSSTSLVRVRVRRDQYLPSFVGDSDREIPVDFDVDTRIVVTVRADDRDRAVSSRYQKSFSFNCFTYR